jgi:general secretion pathway protein F
MKYFIATVLTKGKKEELGFYAEDKKEAAGFAKLKFSGIIIKVTEGKEPFENQLKRFKIDLLKNFSRN